MKFIELVSELVGLYEEIKNCENCKYGDLLLSNTICYECDGKCNWKPEPVTNL